jgi:ankyrin repeat protein
MEGWGAIHYAVFVGNIAIVRYLISIGVNINLKTFDEWLPIQIAINQKNMPMIELLVSQPSLNINICTTRGLPLNMAVKAQNAEIVEKLLTKEVNFSIKDHVGRTALDIVDSNPNKRLKDMLERAQSPTIFTKNIMYHSLITLFRGEVLLIKAPPWKDRIAYLCLNPY